jgi:hypothetical protein
VPNLTSYAEIAGIFKESWENKIVETYRGDCPITARAKWLQGQLNGGYFHRSTDLTTPGGQSFAAASNRSGNVTPGLNGRPYVGARAPVNLDAQIAGMQIHARGNMTYEALARSMESAVATTGDRAKAVQDATKVENGGLMASTVKKLEALMLHGGKGLGSIEAISNVVAATYESVSGFNVDVRVSNATFAAAIWMTFEGHTFDLFDVTAGIPSGTKLNTATNTLLSGVNQTGLVLISIAPPSLLAGMQGGTDTSRVLRFWHSSGTAGVPGTGVIGGWTTDATPDQAIVFESAGVGTEFSGLNLMAANAGTLFGLDSTLYSMWRGNPIDHQGATLKLADLVRYATYAINAGAKGERMEAVVPTELFAQFANDESILRRYDGKTSEARGGMSNIELYLPMKGTLEVLGHNQQKNGEVVMYPPEELHRIGSQDLNFVTRGGTGNNELILELSTAPASEVRLFGQMAPCVDTPRHCVYVGNFTY